MSVLRLRRGGDDLRHIGIEHLDMADRAGRRAIARAHARRAHDAHIDAELAWQFVEEPLGADERARQ